MNREIKFRGKDLATGKWVYGNLVENQGRFFIYHFTSEITLGSITVIASEVAPNTVGQFTGLHDSKGKEIYEGDIVQCDDWFNSEVFYHDDLGAFVVDNTHKQMINLISDFRKTQVVGNIHDNPELMKGE